MRMTVRSVDGGALRGWRRAPWMAVHSATVGAISVERASDSGRSPGSGEGSAELKAEVMEHANHHKPGSGS